MNRSPPRNLPRGAFLFVCLPRCARFRSARALSGPSKPRLRGTSRFRGIDDGEPIRDNHPIDQEGESVLDREVEQALSETPVEVRDPQDEE